jgi:hypothetical protein
MTPCLERRFLELRWWVPPVDLVNDHEIGRIDVYAFRSAHVGKVAAVQVSLESVARHLSYALNMVERPTPPLVRMETEVVESSVDRVRGPIEVTGKLYASDQPDALTEVPVLQLCPGLLAPSDVHSGRRPGLPKCLEMAEDGVERWIRPPAEGIPAALAAPAGEPLPFFG